MSESFLLNLQELKTAALLKRDSCETRQFLRTPCFTEHLQWLLLTVSGFQPAAYLKMRFWQGCSSVNFTKVLRTSFDRTPADDCLLSLSVNFEKFFRIALL